MQKYLEHSEYIDWKTPTVFHRSSTLSSELSGDEAIARACFEWVRDNIAHSYDFKLNPVTCKASDVLTHGTGYCFAKSHLLVALLRANNIPAGLCYQRLSIDETGSPFCLHGLVAVHLEKYGWYRIDPRGNRQGINAQFSPPVEQLAFPIRLNGEYDIPGIFHAPLPRIIELLQKHDSYDAVYENLPDYFVDETN